MCCDMNLLEILNFLFSIDMSLTWHLTWRVKSVASQQFARPGQEAARWNIGVDNGGINLETQDTTQEPAHDTRLWCSQHILSLRQKE